VWDDQVDALAARFRVVRYDIRGLGGSARPTGTFSHSADLAALFELLDLRHAVVCGTSFGAAIAIDFALEHPSRVDALVLVSPGLSSDKDAHVQGATELCALVRAQGLDDVVALLAGTRSFIAVPGRRIEQRLREMYGDNRDVFESDFSLVTLWQPASPPAANRLAEITAPTLVIVGEHDDQWSRATAARIAADVPGANQVTIAGAGHMVNLDAPEEFNRVVIDFLAQAVCGLG
jgi:pimeloyl-ACP methyl ester carboxylesterase